MKVNSNLDLSSGARIVNVPTPAGAGDAASKGYVDSRAAGSAFVQAVRVASVGDVAVAAAPASIDGIALNNGDRLLLRAQTDATQNGLYTFGGAGAALARSGEALENGTTTYVDEGGTNAGAVFTLVTEGAITPGTTAQTWTQTNGLSDVTAGTGLTKTGNQVALQIPVTVADGGTGATTAAGARANLGAATKYAQDIGDGAATSFTVTHNLGTTDVHVSIYDKASMSMETVDWTILDGNRITVGPFSTAPAAAGASSGKRVVIVG